MKFAEAKPLTERGLRWLKIHLANLYGYDKGTFDERVVFVHDHLADIYDSAENPLTVSRFCVEPARPQLFSDDCPGGRRDGAGGKRQTTRGSASRRAWN